MKTQKKKRKHSFILTLALVAIFGYFVITLIQLQIEINDKKEQAAQISQQVEDKDLRNKELKKLLVNTDEDNYMERVARDVLGYVFPGEKVYYDISAGD